MTTGTLLVKAQGIGKGLSERRPSSEIWVSHQVLCLAHGARDDCGQVGNPQAGPWHSMSHLYHKSPAPGAVFSCLVYR